MSFTNTNARRTALLALVGFALGACQDATVSTAPLAMRPQFTQLASAPVVNTLTDTNDGTCDDTHCSLREAIAFASSGATITFASTLTGTITFGEEIQLTKSLTINGPGADVLAISGGDATSLFWLTSGITTISGLTLTHAVPSFSGGGAILVSNAGTALTLTNCAITSSSGGPYGGGIRVSNGSLTVSSCTLSGNQASSGAAIIVFVGSATIVNSTVSGNNGYDAVHVESGATLKIDHSTITGNTGGGLYSASSTPATTVKGSIIWGNTSFDVDAGLDNAFSSLGHNLVGTAGGSEWVNFGHDFAATGDQTGVEDAGLGALALNSPGTTRTHALLTGSPAIDAGVCTDISGATLSADQRGVSRSQGSACDIGAYELVTSTGTTPTFAFSLASLPAKTFGDGAFSVSSYATTNSTGAITFATGIGSVGCSVSSGGTVTITGAAVLTNSCILEASLAADATYDAAGPISSSFHIAKAAGSVTISNLPSSGSVGGSFTPTYTKSGDGTASTVSNSTNICTVTSGVVDFIGAGNCLLQASVAEGTNYLAATGTEQHFTISLTTPDFAFDLSGLPAKTFGNGTFSVASYATTNSTGAVTFELGSTSVGCSVTSSGTVTIDGAAVDPAHCVIAATLAAGGIYAGAGPIEQGFNIARAAGSVSISNMPSSATVGGQFTPTFTRSGDGAASVVSLTPLVCTVTSGVVDFIAEGNCTLRASVSQGTNYLAATGGQQTVIVSLPAVFASACTYTINPRNDQRQVTVTWENASPGVTLIQVADGRTVTKQLAPTTTGSWSTNVKTGVPTYGLWGGASRKDANTTLVAAGTACVQ